MSSESNLPAKIAKPTKQAVKRKKPSIAFKNILAQTFPRYW